MAIFAAIFSPIGGATASGATADVTATLATVTSSAEIVLGLNTLFAINATGDVHIRFGNAGMPAASTADFRIPGGVVATYPLNRNHDRIRIFNPSAGNTTYWIQPLTSAG